MCGRIIQPSPAAILVSAAEFLESPVIAGHKAPTALADRVRPTSASQPIAAILQVGDDLDGEKYTLTTMHWGYPPPDLGGDVIYNTRLESASNKGMWRDDFRSRRCLIPITQFWEGGVGYGSWDDAPMFVGGIFTRENFKDDGEHHLRRASMLTVPAKGIPANSGRRMPAFVQPEFAKEWLRRDQPADYAVVKMIPYRPRLVVTA